MTFQGYFQFALSCSCYLSFVRQLWYMWDNDAFTIIHFAETRLMCRQQQHAHILGLADQHAHCFRTFDCAQLCRRKKNTRNHLLALYIFFNIIFLVTSKIYMYDIIHSRVELNCMKCFHPPCFPRLQKCRSKQYDFQSIEASVLEVIKSRKLQHWRWQM